MKRLSFAGFNNVSYTAGGTVRLHLAASLVLTGLPYLDATLLYVQASRDACEGVIYRYIVEYDEALLVDPSVGLFAEDIFGMTYDTTWYPSCKNELVATMDEFVLSPTELFYARINPEVLNSKFLTACKVNI